MKFPTLLSIARARVFSAPAPIAVGFELTHLCNLSCSYCDRHRRLPNEMTLDQIVTALEGLHSIGMREISLDGGEALAHPDIERVVDWLEAHDIVMRLNTNGVLVRRKAGVVRKMTLVKISLDGPAKVHDSIRGQGAFSKALDALSVCNALSIPTELTCAVGKHNAHFLDEVVSIADSVGTKVIFQPVRPSLFQDAGGPATHLALHSSEAQQVFERISAHKRSGRPVLNAWASLRHFRNFPRNQPLPCAAGWINVTLDPEGSLYHCGQISRADKTNNVVRLGAKAAFDGLERQGCEQCWCARVVEENYAWGGRFDRFLPVRNAGTLSRTFEHHQVSTFEVPASALIRRRSCR
jgi:MoaA/NifB/PqqE/SkfB family radical SAM enzyme